MITEEIAAVFNAAGNNGKYKARCPCHDDRNPSLYITHIDGGTLIHCFAGCNVYDIVDSVGLTIEDLWED